MTVKAEYQINTNSRAPFSGGGCISFEPKEWAVAITNPQLHTRLRGRDAEIITAIFQQEDQVTKEVYIFYAPQEEGVMHALQTLYDADYAVDEEAA